MDFDLKTMTEWVLAFVDVLKNPVCLIFYCAFISGIVIKNIGKTIAIPDWLIPAILSFIGFVCGWTFLFACESWHPIFASGMAGHFQAAIFGMTLGLAAVGFHQLGNQVKNRNQGTTPEVKPQG